MSVFNWHLKYPWIPPENGAIGDIIQNEEDMLKPPSTQNPYITTEFDETDEGKKLKWRIDDLKGQLNKYLENPFKYSRADALTEAGDNYLNFRDFDYDINQDALYQSMLDNYTQRGKLAMQDAMGQASLLSGGYANSYAQTVGQQAYMGEIDNLNDAAADLYGMAYDRYNNERDHARDEYAFLAADEERERANYYDPYYKLLEELEVATGEYDSASSAYYDKIGAKNDATYKELNSNATPTISEENGYTVTDENLYKEDGSLKEYTFLGEDPEGNGNVYRDPNGKNVVVSAGVNPYTSTMNPGLKDKDGNYSPEKAFENGYQPNNIGYMYESDRDYWDSLLLEFLSKVEKGEKTIGEWQAAVNGELKDSGITDFVNGKKEKVYEDPFGQLWIWSSAENDYLRYEE